MTEAFALVLHSHLPYARGAGRWPHGEEWVHEAILGTYLPLLGLLHDLRDDGVAYQITIGLTPTLIEQLADHDIDARSIARTPTFGASSTRATPTAVRSRAFTRRCIARSGTRTSGASAAISSARSRRWRAPATSRS
jgi:hypothetical protein